MEDYRSICGRVGFLCFFLGIFLLIGHAKAAENIKNPRANVNLGPIQGWRSAYHCLWNISQQCSDPYVLKDKGVVNVLPNEVEEYCKPEGCRDHTLAVLKCIYDVKRDFWFANNATVKVLNETIINGCAKSQAFSTLNYNNPKKQKEY